MKRIRKPLPASSIDEFWAFVQFVGRSIYDPWWNTSEADRTFATWKAVQS